MILNCYSYIYYTDVELCTIIENASRIPRLVTRSFASEEERIRRLNSETDEMKERFAVLVGKTLYSLRKHEVSIGELKAFLKNVNGPKVTNNLEKVTDISEAFDVLYDFWSFFDSKILGFIVRSFCSDLNPDFKEFVSKFEEYCVRRVCEEPDDSYEKKYYFQIDETFLNEVERLNLKMPDDLRYLTDNLRSILGIDICIMVIKKGRREENESSPLPIKKGMNT